MSLHNLLAKLRRKRQRDLDDPKRLRQRYPQYQIGKGSYGDLKIHSWDESTKFEMGAYCSIADGVQVFLGGEHRADWVSTYPFSVFWPSAQTCTGHPASKGDVIVGNDVWIGTEAIILSGVRIGNGAIIGARAVVTKDVPAYAIVAGNPARIVRKRFDDSTVERLQNIQWWNWDANLIEAFLPLMLANNVSKFLDAAEERL